MIRSRLRVLLAERGLSASRLSQATGIQRSTLSHLMNNRVTRYQADVLDRICRYLGCQVGDLLVYVPEVGRRR